MAASIGSFSTFSKWTCISQLLGRNYPIGYTCIVRHCSANAKENKKPASPTPDEVREWKKINWRAYATGRVRLQVPEDPDFPVMLIPGHSVLPQVLEKREQAKRPPMKLTQPRYRRMLPEQDWTDVWPTAHTFKWSVVPFPVRQGFVKPTESALPREKYGNAELMKIPNFLHLTPQHVQKHCAAIKKFCTPWPKALEDDTVCDKHFPLRVITRDYVADGPTMRDPRARFVTIQLKLSSLKLDEHAKDKFLKLVGDRYNKETDVLTLEADRCPVRKQNYEYTLYLLTALYHESWKQEPWEADQTEVDMIKFEWPLTTAKAKVLDTIIKIKQAQQEKGSKVPKILEDLPDTSSPDLIEKTEIIQEYKEVLSELYEHGEDVHQLEKYKNTTKKLLIGL
ncbi:hypothetical protein LSH36_135g04011 [Paralvinella palmiformis]|uniref:Small ribosomal subunit protein mS35 mitochondrial conserved domain-containing protein n=1 Tax=Paralvinella palmiformis TaxID=53620 RepID=A0AAD9NAS3_9ANNE|nr:hypothetical protein LSH36_135g04011 [Paralvinella palmiformis]